MHHKGMQQNFVQKKFGNVCIASFTSSIHHYLIFFVSWRLAPFANKLFMCSLKLASFVYAYIVKLKQFKKRKTNAQFSQLSRDVLSGFHSVQVSVTLTAPRSHVTNQVFCRLRQPEIELRCRCN